MSGLTVRPRKEILEMRILARKLTLGSALAFFALLPAGAVLRAESDGRESGSEALLISGRVLPAPGETTLPPVVWVVLRASGARPYERKQLLHRAEKFQFREVPNGNYILSVKSEGYATSTLELQDGSAVAGRRGLFIALGSRLTDRSLPPAGQATIDLATLKIPKKALREFQKASEQSEKNRLDWALEHLRKAIALHPDFFQAYNNLGTIYLRMGDYPEAEAAFLNAIEINPNSAMVYRNLGLTYILTNRWEGVVNMELNPDNHTVWANRAGALVNLGRNEEALAASEKAIELNPDNAVGWANRAGALANLGRAGEALESVDKAIDISPDNDSILRFREKLLKQ